MTTPQLSTALVLGAILVASFGAAAQKPPAPFKVEIKERKVVGERVLRVKQGDTVRLRWVSDEGVEVHVHGYSIKTKIEAGKHQDVSFTARATGRFPITSHGFVADKNKAIGGHGHGAPHKESALIYIEVHPR